MGFWRHLFSSFDHTAIVNQQCSLATKLNLLQSQSDRLLDRIRDLEKAIERLRIKTNPDTAAYPWKTTGVDTALPIDDPHRVYQPPKVRSQYFRTQAENAPPTTSYTAPEVLMAGGAGLLVGAMVGATLGDHVTDDTDTFRGHGGESDGGGASSDYSVDSSSSSCDSGSSSSSCD